MSPYRRNARRSNVERLPSFLEAWIVRFRHRHDATGLSLGIWLLAVLLCWLAGWYITHV